MGSGRGTTRRAQAATQTASSYDERKWREFANENGLANYKVADYYLESGNGKLSTKDQPTCEKLLREFLQDSILTGALTLPSGVAAEELVLDYAAPTQNGWYATSTLTLSVQKSGKVTSKCEETARMSNYLNPNAKVAVMAEALSALSRMLNNLS